MCLKVDFFYLDNYSKYLAAGIFFWFFIWVFGFCFLWFFLIKKLYRSLKSDDYAGNFRVWLVR